MKPVVHDGGIGNMSGSDDRPIEEWTLLEKLAEIAGAGRGGPIPRCIIGKAHDDWATPLKALAQAAFDEIQRLRDLTETRMALAAHLSAIASCDIGDGLAPTPIDLLNEAAQALGGVR